MKRLRELPIGTTVGDNYRLLRRLGEGSIGTVYEAGQAQGRRCALKLVTGVIADDRAAVERFGRQADVASRLIDPHLVRVFDYGVTSSGTAFLVMEYLEGEDLGTRFRRTGPHDPATVSYIVRRVATALAVAHERGIVHGALKPANVFLVPVEGEPPAIKLLDCGTATIDDARMVKHDTMLEDTLPYVAPEQANPGGEPLDPRCDQWALGCMAWQLLTGRAPFQGEDATALLYQITYEDPQLAEDGPRPAQAILQVLLRTLEKRPAQRFADTTAFADALEQVAGTLAVPVRKRRQPASPANRPTSGKQPQAAGAPPLTGLPPRAPMAAAETAMGYPQPVFLPGMTPREAAPRRTNTGAQTRVQGLRVRTADRSEGSADTLAQPEGEPATASARRILARLGGFVLRRPWVVAAALPAMALIFLVANWAGGRQAVNVERAPGATAPSPAPVGLNTTARPTGRPVIEPLTSPRASRASMKDRRRGRGLRAKRAVASAKARRAEAAAGATKERRGDNPRRRR